jgi:hypothetical protein
MHMHVLDMREHLWPFFLATRFDFGLVNQTRSIIEAYGSGFASVKATTIYSLERFQAEPKWEMSNHAYSSKTGD